MEQLLQKIQNNTGLALELEPWGKYNDIVPKDSFHFSKEEFEKVISFLRKEFQEDESLSDVTTFYFLHKGVEKVMLTPEGVSEMGY